jgi:hypothetical protein
MVMGVGGRGVSETEKKHSPPHTHNEILIKTYA